jgi:2-oxoglutarate ferredoxin oxidoreductase subunit beta
MSLKELDTGVQNTWCPGCGNFGILTAMKQAILQLGIPRERIVGVSGIGCHSKITDYIKVNGLHAIHGRVLPAATGVKLANHGLTVVGYAGDGDAFNIGLGHFAHAARRNVPVAYIVHDNMIYGLTAGQTSPTSRQGFKTKTTPRGAFEAPINPLTQALAAGASFVARGFAGEPKHLVELFKQAITHRGFAMVDVLQPCVTFNKVNTYEFYRQRVYRLEDGSHDAGDFEAAYRKALEWGERIPIGVFFREERPTYLEGFPALRDGPLAGRELKPDISGLVDEFR